MYSLTKRIIIGILIVCLVGTAVWFIFPEKELTVTVQATVYLPTDEDYFVTEYNGYHPYKVFPNKHCLISEVTDEHKASFRRGTINSWFDHGPKVIEGSFSAVDLSRYWQDIPLESDWPFQLALYNTSSGRKFQMYLDLEIYTDRLDAKATLYVFCLESAHPVIRTWEGNVGDEIVFVLEV